MNLIYFHRNHLTIVLLVSIVGTVFSSAAVATQDIDDPDSIRDLLGLVLVQPLVANEILRLAEQGCTWKDEVFWSGSPSEEDLRTKIFWMTFSTQFSTISGELFWKSFAFSSKDGPILEIIETTQSLKTPNCSE